MPAGAPKGNTNAKGKRVWSDALRKHAIQNGSVNKVAKQLIKMAEDGDLGAIKELGDRLEGKAVQAIEGQLANIDMTHEQWLESLKDE